MATKKKPTKKRFDQGAGVRELARERVGIVKPAKPIIERDERTNPKHKKDLLAEE